MQANALSVLLHKFYQHRADGTKDVYTRSEPSKALLLFHCAIVALLAEGFHMLPAVFDSFREHLRIGPQQLRTIFRWALGLIRCSPSEAFSRSTLP